MQERPTKSDHTNVPGHDSTNPSSTHRLYFISSWLDKFESSKLECYSVLFGVSGISFLALSLCLSIIIHTTHERRITNTIDCSIINVTHTHVKLCPSRRCQIFNYCIPYICTIVLVLYQLEDISYKSKLFSSHMSSNSSCSYEPSSCVSRSHIQSEQITFLKNVVFNHSKTIQCCLHSQTQQPMTCPNYLNSTQHFLMITAISISFFASLVLLLIGTIIQLHLNNYLQIHSRDKEDFLKTILNFHFSNGTIRSSFGEIMPVNYEILTQTISQRNTPSTTTTTTTNMYPDDNLLLFDIEEENQMFKQEYLREDYQEQMKNESIRLV